MSTFGSFSFHVGGKKSFCSTERGFVASSSFVVSLGADVGAALLGELLEGASVERVGWVVEDWVAICCAAGLSSTPQEENNIASNATNTVMTCFRNIPVECQEDAHASTTDHVELVAILIEVIVIHALDPRLDVRRVDRLA